MSKSVILKRKEFIKVSLIFIGCILSKNGILTPILKFPFYVHYNKYKESKANIPVAKNPTPLLSNPVNISFRNDETGNPEEFLAKTNKILFYNFNLNLHMQKPS